MTTIEAPRTIELAKWTSAQFLRPPREVWLPEWANIGLPLVQPADYTPQLDPKSFIEFEHEGSQYPADLMRIGGCGVCSLHMVNATLAGKPYTETFPTVGSLTKQALSLHKNDTVVNNIRIRRGTPVYNKEVGWYHDALLYVASRYANLEVYRQEGLTSWEQVAKECLENANQKRIVLIIVSLKNEFWRRRGERPSNATHLAVINGFKINSGRVTEIQVTDPYVDPNPEAPRYKINEWIIADEKVRAAFRGKAMYFLRQ